MLSIRRKRSPSSETNDALGGAAVGALSGGGGGVSVGEPAPKMVQVNGSVMVPAELTNQRSSPGNNNNVTPKPSDIKLEGIPEIAEDNEEFLAFLA